MKKISMLLVVTVLCTMFLFTGNLAYAAVPYSGEVLASGLTGAIGIVIGPDGKVYVSDYYGNKIVQMDKNGSNLTTVTTNVSQPIGLAFNSAGNLIVAEHAGRKIAEFDSAGNKTIIKDTCPGLMTGIAVDSHGKIFALDYTYGKIYKMDANGSNCVEFATILDGASAVTSSLIGMGIDASNNLYLSDRTNSRIIKVDSNGVQSDFASVSSPNWASVGKDGYLYASSADKTIKKFDLTGNKIETYSTGTYTPWGTQIDAGGAIYFGYFGTTVNRILGYADTVDRTHVKITLFSNMVNGAADPSAFTLSGVASSPQVTSAVVSGSEINLTLDSNIESTDTTVKVSYTKTGTNNLVQQGTSIEVDAFSNLSVTNHIVGVASVGTLSTINVDNGTVLSAVSLPATVSVNLSNSTTSTTSAAVVWDGGTPAYDGNTAGTYTFSGTLSLGTGIYNPENKKAAVDVVVAAASTAGTVPPYIPISTTPSNDAPVIVGGTLQTGGTFENGTDADGQTVTTVTLDPEKFDMILNEAGSGATFTIPVTTGADVAAGVLNGQMIRDMKTKNDTFVIQTPSSTYTISASDIDMDAVSAQFGEGVSLSNIKVEIKIAQPSADTVKVVADAATEGGFTLVVPALEFTITCTHDGKSAEVSSFNAYVERMIAIPEGVDSSKITTGIVVDLDGNTHHVPTTIVMIDGKYYAKINSLTNSTYAVIYNPVEFTDAADHWARATINNMGSRMIISGTGNSNFEPDRDITRAEFAAVVVRALGLAPGMGDETFSDVAKTAWYDGYIKTAAAYGIITGYDDGRFGPNDTITREQAMTMIARAMKLTKLMPNLSEASKKSLLEGFSDAAKVSAYAGDSAAQCISAGVVLGGPDGTIAPQAFITRAEVAVIVERLLQKSGLI